MKTLLQRLKHKLSPGWQAERLPQEKESVYFYTFHKCASSFFSSYVLKNIEGLKHVDYAMLLWDKPPTYNEPLEFKRHGTIYGPIRLSAGAEITVKFLVEPSSNPEFVRDKSAIFFVRDPRAILVSRYYSFGFTHALNPNEEKRKAQLKRMEKIQTMTLDDYVLAHADKQVRDFAMMKGVAAGCKRKLVLKYEDMIDKFESFASDLRSFVEIRDEVIQHTYSSTRPRESVDNFSHHRSGHTQTFREELKPETLVLLNQ
ncbi:MAG: sulfotransferase domain-containing protein [Verrucomicrobiales bacterium]